MTRPRPTIVALLLVLLVLLILPVLVRLSLVTVLINLLIFAALAYAINFITGLTGYVSFGHVVFMGIGAYGLGALSTLLHLHPIVGVVLGAILAAAFAFGIGLVNLRFRGVYFAISTLVLPLSAGYIVIEIPQLGGGIGLILDVGFQPLAIYYTVWVVVLAAILTTYAINRGKLGYGIRAVKSDEDAARTLGINAPRLKLFLFILSGLFAGAAGAVFAWSTSGVYPYIVFDLIFSLQMLAMIIIGGMGTSLGPMIGASIVYPLSYYFLTIFPGAQLIIIGAMVIVIALFIPSGIVGTLRTRFPTLREVLE